MKRKNLVFALVLGGAMSVAASASCIGNCGTDTANGDVTNAPGFSSYSYVSTAGGATGGGNYPDPSATPNSNATDGSTLTSGLFTGNAGDSLSFNFNFITSDGTGKFPDFAWAVLEDGNGVLLDTLFSAQTTPTGSGNTTPDTNLPANAATLTPGTTVSQAGSGASGGPVWNELGDSSGSCYTSTQSNGCGLTGWINSLYTISAADVASDSGTFELVFGVSNATDTAFDTGLAIAGEQIAGQDIDSGASPEPSTWAMLGGALMLLGYFGRRRVVNQ